MAKHRSELSVRRLFKICAIRISVDRLPRKAVGVFPVRLLTWIRNVDYKKHAHSFRERVHADVHVSQDHETGEREAPEHL